jgi:drug/metabolite transporter (DMT)-like permease
VFLVVLSAACSFSGRALRGVRQAIAPIAIVTLLDMAMPTFLTAWGEQHVSSSAAGILTAIDPLFTAVLAPEPRKVGRGGRGQGSAAVRTGQTGQLLW